MFQTRNESAKFDASRRRFLRGAGLSLSLPLLVSARGATATEVTASAAATTSKGAPLRMAFVYFPNGANQDHWPPQGVGRDFQLSRTLAPLEDLKSHVQIISGLDHIHATAGPDGAGDHARANATFLTGARARKTAGADIFVGESVDQFAAKRLGDQTRFSSLELTCDAVRKSGGCDSGYSCAYQYNLSWRSPTSPMTPEPNPRAVFERLFGGNESVGLANNPQEQKSLLDFVMEDARALQREVGKQDQRKLDEYLTGVREIEKRIQRTERFGIPTKPNMEMPQGIPDAYGDHMTIMFDLLAMAFQTDATRVATLLLAGDGSNRVFPQIGIPEGHHYLTHQNETDKKDKVAQIDRYYMEHFAKFLKRLDGIQDIDGNSVLHNSMIVYGGGIGDGNRHNHDNLPLVLAGHGGGSLQPGQHLKVPSMPMTNLFMSMLDRMGVKDVDRFGDSNGRVEGI